MFAICLSLVFLSTELNGIFVSMGNYSEYVMYGLNDPECGLIERLYDLNESIVLKCILEGKQKSGLNIIGETVHNNSMNKALDRIYSGRDAFEGEAPWHVFLELVLNGGSYSCGGALITLEWVLTAAHCLDSLDSGFAYAGSKRKFGGVKIRLNTRKVFQHSYYLDPGSAKLDVPEASTKVVYEIGMVKLETKFDRKFLKDRHYLINTICLPKADQINLDYEWAAFTGFGMSGEGPKYPNNLQIGAIVLAPRWLCLIIDTVCAHHEFNVTKGCPGDSGGPLYQNDENDVRATIAGIYSGSSVAKCKPGYEFGYWTAVSKFIPWILNIIETNYLNKF